MLECKTDQAVNIRTQQFGQTLSLIETIEAIHARSAKSRIHVDSTLILFSDRITQVRATLNHDRFRLPHINGTQMIMFEDQGFVLLLAGRQVGTLGGRSFSSFFALMN